MADQPKFSHELVQLWVFGFSRNPSQYLMMAAATHASRAASQTFNPQLDILVSVRSEKHTTYLSV